MPHSRRMAFWSSKNNPQVSAEALHALYGGLLQVPCFSVTLDESPNHLPQAPPASLRVLWALCHSSSGRGPSSCFWVRKGSSFLLTTSGQGTLNTHSFPHDIASRNSLSSAEGLSSQKKIFTLPLLSFLFLSSLLQPSNCLNGGKKMQKYMEKNEHR